jgi:integrase
LLDKALRSFAVPETYHKVYLQATTHMAIVYLSPIMSARIKHLWERSKTGPFWMKRRVPLDLVGRIGKTEITVGLKTRDLKVAARLIAKHVAEQDRMWAELRNPTRQGSIEEGRRLLATYGIDPVTPLDSHEAARWAFEDLLDAHLPHYLREADSASPEDLDRHLPPAHRAALQAYQGRLEHLASDCMREYVEARTDDPQSVKSAKLPFDYLIKLIGDKPLRKYRRLDVRQYVDHLLAGDHSPTGKAIATSTVERYITTLRAAFARSIREHELGITNVWQGTIEFPKGAKGAAKRESFTVDNYRTLFGAVGDLDQTDDLRCLLVLLAETGARLAEIVGLRAADCHARASVPYVHIQAHGSRSIKTAHSDRRVPLTPRGLQALQRALGLSKGGAYLFPRYTDETGCNATAASAALNGWLRARGIDRTCHSMRHGMRDLLRAVTAPQDVVEQIQGWGKESQSSRYGAGHSLGDLAGWLGKATACIG